MPETKTVTLKTGESAVVLGLKITFAGGSTVHYGSRPPAGCILLDLAFGGEEERATLMDRNWGDEEQIFGFTYRVLNEKQLSPTEAKLEVRGRDG